MHVSCLMWPLELEPLSLPTVTVVIRKKTEYENMDNDIVEGEEDGRPDDEDGETEMLPVNEIDRL